MSAFSQVYQIYTFRWEVCICFKQWFPMHFQHFNLTFIIFLTIVVLFFLKADMYTFWRGGALKKVYVLYICEHIDILVSP